MDSKQRVMTAILRQQPDRVPLDFSANNDTLCRLKADLQISDLRGLLEYLHVDILDIRGVIDPVFVGPIPYEHVKDGIKENFWGMRTKKMDTVTGVEDSYCDFVLGGCQTVKELEEHLWPSPDWFDFSHMPSQLAEWNDFAVMASGASIWQHASFLRSLDNLLMDMAAAPDMAEFIMDKFTDFYLGYFDKMFKAADGRIDIFRIADDLGMQDRLLISPSQFDFFIAPRLKKLVDLAHSYDIKVMFHSCGAIEPLISKLIETGVDILDPIQVKAAGMQPDVLKKLYGDQICFHGAIDTQFVLPKGTPALVAETVEEMINVLGRNGGYILSPSHVLQTDVSTENIKSLYLTAREKGVY